MSKEIRVLFLGAGKRLSLLEAFERAAQSEGLSLTMFSAERSSTVPIASIATIKVAPDFRAPDFAPWLINAIRTLRIDIVIPNMDAATVALSASKTLVEETGCWAIVSTHSICSSMEDKALSERWFLEHHIRVPQRHAWPRIIKPRLGFAARGQVVVRDADEREQFFTGKDRSGYIEQDFLEGPEYSVDAYVDRTGRLVAAMPRQRLKVVDGEVEESLSRRHAEIERLTGDLFSEPGWLGPLTAQFIDSPSGPQLLEVNPRFGGGVTHAIHCGLDMPRWILRERTGRALPDTPVAWQEDSFMTRCRKDIFL